MGHWTSHFEDSRLVMLFQLKLDPQPSFILNRNLELILDLNIVF